MTTAGYAPSHRWELESLYPGGAGGSAIEALRRNTQTGLRALYNDFEALPTLGSTADSADRWATALLDLERSDDALVDLIAYAGCLVSADVQDLKARRLEAANAGLLSLREQIDVPIWAKLAASSDDDFGRFIQRADVDHMALTLTETRERARISMAPELEHLNAELARDGFHAWGRLYDAVAGALCVELDRGDGPEQLSVEQAKNLLESRDPALRQRTAVALDDAWDSQKRTLAAALNHINGYRHTLYARRGIDELEIPLRGNRLSRATLETMFEAIADFRPVMTRFLRAKASRLGLPKLRWFDVDVPLGAEARGLSYEEAQRFIVEEFGAFSTRLGEFAQNAFARGWIEAEDRAGKRHGGFCTGFPLHTQSRIFMTFGNTAGSVQTLAHELGHAYHSEVMWDLPRSQREYPATLAETASTFAEVHCTRGGLPGRHRG